MVECEAMGKSQCVGVSRIAPVISSDSGECGGDKIFEAAIDLMDDAIIGNIYWCYKSVDTAFARARYPERVFIEEDATQLLCKYVDV